MKCDRSSHARTAILMISVICKDQERQQEGWEDRSMVMMMMKEDLGCILALAEESEHLDFPEGGTATCTVAHHQKPNKWSTSLAQDHLMTCSQCEVRLY